MTYSFKINTTKGITKENPLKTLIRVSRGVFVSWRINFPPGSDSTLNVAFYLDAIQIMPADAGTSIVGDNSQAGGTEFLPILFSPYNFEIVTWNEDSVNDHICYGELHIVPLWSLSPFSEKFRILLETEEQQEYI